MLRSLLRKLRFGVRYARQTRSLFGRTKRWFLVVLAAIAAVVCLQQHALSIVPVLTRHLPIFPASSATFSPTPRPEVESLQANAPNLLQRGKELYAAGQLFEAARSWQRAAGEYEGKGELFKTAQALNYLALVEQDLGNWEAAQSAIVKSLHLLQSRAQLPSEGLALLAQALNNQGSLQLARGETQAALETWQEAETFYDRATNQQGKLGSQINQATALQILGYYRRAEDLLEKVNAKLQNDSDSLLKAEGLSSLGRALQITGNLRQAKEILEQSWAISERLGATAEVGATLLSIGNLARALKQYDVALEYYQEAAAKVQTAIAQGEASQRARLEAQINRFSLLVATGKQERALEVFPSIESALATLTPSRFSVYARVNLAESLMKIENGANIARLLAEAVQQAKQLSDPRAEAYALTQLGKLYQQNQQLGEAQALIEQATQMAQTIHAEDIVARSVWQLGRILKQQGDIDGAIAAYEQAIATLQSLRSDLATINREIQFDFKESVEPVYREFVGLLLQGGQGEISQANLQKAREAIEALQIAEIDNFFQEACFTAQSVKIDRIDPQAAIIYPIILSDRLEVILSLPNRPLQHYTTPLPRVKLEETLQNLYSSFYVGYSSIERLHLSAQVYDWLIRPAETEFANNNIKTLVFVLDGFLQNLPMGALYDGRQYLIEKYSIALSPGLQLVPDRLDKRHLEALTAGLTKARQGFPPLPGVELEVRAVASEVDAKVLIDGSFTRTAFQNQMSDRSFDIVHLATHGQFSSNPEETFVLAWDERINVKDFDRILQSQGQRAKAVDLLVLSACRTASGDRRAALGLAGFALRSGARSTLATLWSVSDKSAAELMSEFYQQLVQSESNTTKAEALRQAQLKLLTHPRYQHPYFWAPFVLVGNWL